MKRTLWTVLLVGFLALTGCRVAPNENVLPGGVATGDDGFEVTATFESVGNLVPNSEIRYNNVEVGTVLDIEVKGWQAEATMVIKSDLVLPANVLAVVGQKSLLGAEYVELVDPVKPAGKLAAGDVITIGQTGGHPGTEEVLSAVSLSLNNGGLSQIQTISKELNTAFRGRTGTTRQLIDEVATFSAALDDQKSDLVRSLEAVDRLSEKFATEKKTVARAIDTIGPGLTSVNANRVQLEKAIKQVGRLNGVATTVINESGDALVSNLEQLTPILTELRKAGVALPQASRLLTFPFPLEHVDRVVRGDYANLFITLDVTAATITKDFGLLDSPASNDAENPLLSPLLNGASKPDQASGSDQAQPTPHKTRPAPKSSPTPTPTPTPAPPEPTGCDVLRLLLGGC